MASDLSYYEEKTLRDTIAAEILSEQGLKAIIDAVAAQIPIQNVYSSEQLEEWAKAQLSKTLNVGDVYTKQEVADWASENLDVDDVFSDSQLEDWAINNGFERKKS